MSCDSRATTSYRQTCFSSALASRKACATSRPPIWTGACAVHRTRTTLTYLPARPISRSSNPPHRPRPGLHHNMSPRCEALSAPSTQTTPSTPTKVPSTLCRPRVRPSRSLSDPTSSCCEARKSGTHPGCTASSSSPATKRSSCGTLREQMTIAHHNGLAHPKLQCCSDKAHRRRTPSQRPDRLSLHLATGPFSRLYNRQQHQVMVLLKSAMVPL